MNLDQMLRRGFSFEICPVEREEITNAHIRLKSPDGQVNIGEGGSVQEATLNALAKMVLSLEEYLRRTENKFNRAEEALHRTGEVVNLLDGDEVGRMRERKAERSMGMRKSKEAPVVYLCPKRSDDDPVAVGEKIATPDSISEARLFVQQHAAKLFISVSDWRWQNDEDESEYVSQTVDQWYLIVDWSSPQRREDE